MLDQTLEFLMDHEDSSHRSPPVINYYRQMTPSQIESRINRLLTRFSKKESAFAGLMLIDHIETLLQHIDYRASLNTRCTYRHLQRRLQLWVAVRDQMGNVNRRSCS